MAEMTTSKMTRDIDRAIDILKAAKEIIAGSLEPRMKVEEAAAYLRCTKQHIYDLIREGKLQCMYVGRTVTFDRSAIIAYNSRKTVKEEK